MEQMRLNKYLADRGICSRREADRLIEQCRVTVNGQIASMGCKVSEEDAVSVNGKQIAGRPERVVLAFHKPVGVTCTEKDRHAEKIITDMIRYPVRVTYAGRLDKDSEGLILLTNDGALIDGMMRGANRHEKEYVVKVNKEVTDDFLKAMGAGIYLKDLDKTTRSCQVEKTGKYTFRILLTQGLNRQIRRMCRALGYEVRKLQRIRIMNITLDGIPYGKYRELTAQEIQELYERTGLSDFAHRKGSGRGLER